MADTTNPKKKIAVLGGGPASMAAVYYILNALNWNKDAVDITVYQMGWRLGGKCASGRNMENHARVEEHGIHFWFGCYHNAFRWIKDCYARVAAIGYKPHDWKEALIPSPSYVGFENLTESWDMWRIQPLAWEEDPDTYHYPDKDVDLIGSMGDHAIKGFEILLDHIRHHTETLNLDSSYYFIVKFFQKKLGASRQDAEKLISKLESIRQKFATLNQSGNFATDHPGVVKLLEEIQDAGKFIGDTFYDYLETHQTSRRLFVIADLGLAVLTGMLKDGVLHQGFDAINDIDFLQWLRKHGARDITLQNTMTISYYDGAFAFRGGDKRFPNSEAGTTLKGIMLALLTNDWSMFFKFRGSMGEIVFTPYYLLLKEYGVKFKFFHKVKNLKLSADKKSIAAVEMEKQVHLKSGRDDDYDPLVEVKGVKCWPSAPKYEQLAEGDAIIAEAKQGKNVDLESFWTEWKGEDISIEAGKDFDQVIFGIPIGSVPYLCTELLQESEAWRNMVSAIETVPTQSLQLWTSKKAEDLGWPYHDSKIYTTYTEPLDTWCSNQDLIAVEDWPKHHAPKDVLFFTGVLQDSGQIPPPRAHNYPSFMKDRVFGQFIEFIVNHMQVPVPMVKPMKGYHEYFNWFLLHDDKSRMGTERMRGQYYRANVDPSERYVLSVENSSQYRLATDQTGFENLFITGDWIKTLLNSGCFEGAMMAGIETAKAITSHPSLLHLSPSTLRVLGENSFNPIPKP